MSITYEAKLNSLIAHHTRMLEFFIQHYDRFDRPDEKIAREQVAINNLTRSLEFKLSIKA